VAEILVQHLDAALTVFLDSRVLSFTVLALLQQLSIYADRLLPAAALLKATQQNAEHAKTVWEVDEEERR
jgi:hypothetical protein